MKKKESTKGIIIYKSNYGSTHQYARWLSEETGFKALSSKQVKKDHIEKSDVVIFGSPIFAGNALLSSTIKKKWRLLKDKKVILYTTSGCDGDDPKLMSNFKACFHPSIREKLKYFPQGGRVVRSKMTPFHKILMRLGESMEKDPIVKEAMAKDKDRVNRNGIKEILEYIG